MTPYQEKVEAFMAALESLILEYPAENFPRVIRIIRSYADLGSIHPMREVAIAQSNVPPELVIAIEALIFG